MQLQEIKLPMVLGLSAVITYVVTRFLNVSYGFGRDGKGTYPQTISDSNKNIFEGTFQPALININIGSNNK